MAERRMFAKTIIDSDAFIDMPVTARLLYYDLSMRADDDGFVNSPKKIMRMIGASQDDLSILIMKKFIIPFDNGVVVIKHWRIHNYIRKDRYSETTYSEQKNLLALDENNAYTLKPADPALECHQETDIRSTDGQPSVDHRATQDRLGKERLGEVNVEEPKGSSRQTDVRRVVDEWNRLVDVSPISRVSPDSTRYKLLCARLKEYGVEKVLKAIENVAGSSFLRGQSNSSWVITFDWFVKPNNFCKVLEGNYNDRKEATGNCRSNQESKSTSAPGQEASVDRLARLMREGAFEE